MFAGQTELLLRWSRHHRGPEQNTQEFGQDNRGGDSVKCIGSTLPGKPCETLFDDLDFLLDLLDRGGQVEGAV